MAGGASLAPRRWSLAAVAMVARRRSWCVWTAWITAVQKNRKTRFACGVSPGSRRLSPVSVDIEKLTCLPLPLTPANGFSWRRHASPNRVATRCSVIIMTCWWSAATFAFSKMGAISYWPGATSLWRVATGTPSV